MLTYIKTSLIVTFKGFQNLFSVFFKLIHLPYMFLNICYKYGRQMNEYDFVSSCISKIPGFCSRGPWKPTIPSPWMLSPPTCWLKSLRAQFTYHLLYEACCDPSSQKSFFLLLNSLDTFLSWVMDYILLCIIDIFEYMLFPPSTNKPFERKKISCF